LVPKQQLALGDEPPLSPVVRTEPIQERSAARIDALLDAAAAVVDETGFERLTTAMVAERAGASIGTVYRYFPDRIALLQALRDRALLRYRLAVAESIKRESPEHWWEAVETAIDTVVEFFRTEPGFRIVRFEDEERSSESSGRTLQAASFAERFAETLSEEFGLPRGDELDIHLNVVVEIGDSMISRAFLIDPQGDERFISETKAVIRSYLAGHYGN
jgi:AcrR family transcriptional regulator